MHFNVSYCDLRHFDDKLDAILAHQAEIALAQQAILNQGAALMSGIEALKQNLVDIRDLAQQYLALIISKDAAAAALQQKINALVDASNLAAAEKTQLLADIDSAVTASQTTEDALRAGLPGVPPVGGTPLTPSYADRASFDAAVAAYTGPEGVTLDGSQVKAGTTPSLDYFSHSADGSINTSGPKD